MLNLNLHPVIRSTLVHPPSMDQSLRVDTRTLWKVALGFLPFYVNLYKRLYDQHEIECKELESARSIDLEKEQHGPEQSDTMRSTPSLPDVEWSDISEASSTPSLPEVEWSDITESSTGWSDSDTTVFRDTSDSSASSDTESESSLAYSNALSDDSSWSSNYSTWRKDPTGGDLSWMEKVSRAVFGSPIP